MSINELFLNPPRGIIDHSSSEMKKERALAQEKSAVSASVSMARSQKRVD